MRIGGTNGVNGPQHIYPKLTEQGPAKAAGRTPEGDRVELSDAARLSAAIARIPDVRTDKVAAARELMAAGQLDTPEVMDIALDRLIEDAMSQLGAE